MAAPTGATAAVPRSRARALVVLGLLAATTAVYAQVREQDFVGYDDPVYVVENPRLATGLSSESLWRAFAEPYETNWIPLTWISLQLDHALWGLDPAGYKLENAILHALSALLLFLALSRATGATWRSAFVAAVFALHPLHVESVAWVAERKDTLSGVFFMLALLAHVRYAEAPSVARALPVFAAMALGLLAKPSLVTLPFALLLLDFWPLRRLGGSGPGGVDPRRLGRAVLEKTPLFIAAAVVSAITMVVQREAGAMADVEMLPLAHRVENAVVSYAVYLGKSLWPANLAIFYPHPLGGSGAAAVALGGVVLLLGTAAAAASVRARPYVTVGWLWYVGTLIPVIGLVQVGMQAYADRYTYLPLIGPSLIVAWGAGEIATRHPRLRTPLVAAAVAGLAALGVTAHLQVRHWRDNESLWERAVAATGENYFAENALGHQRLFDGDAEAAQAHFTEAARLKPEWGGAHSGLGDALYERGRYPEAILRYQRALKHAPLHLRAREGLGRTLLEVGRGEESIEHYRRALELGRPSHAPRLHARLGEAHARAGRLRKAERQYARAIELRPTYAEAHANLGLLLIRADRTEEARRALERAVALGEPSAEVHLGLAQVSTAAGDAAGAVAHYRQALALRPGWPHPANNLAWLLATHPSPAIRRPAEAVRLAERLVDGGPAPSAATLDTLAAAYAADGRFDDAVATADRAVALAADPRLEVELRARLALYGGGRPYRDPTLAAEPTREPGR